MRILIVDTFYPVFLRAHYRNSPNLEVATYDLQWRALMDTCFGTADAYSHFLGELGHAARELVVNCAPLQAAWAREHGVRSRFLRPLSRASSVDVLAAQVEDFVPDVLYVQNLSAVDVDVLRRLGTGRLVVGQIASEPPAERQLRAFDLILTSFPHYVSRFQKIGIASEYFRIGFDERSLGRVGSVPRDRDVAFVGSLGVAQHRIGNGVLGSAAEHLPLDVWGTGIEEWPPGSALRRRYRGEAWGIDMLRLLARARIALNRHIDAAEGFANNMRLYEATGMGALLLTDAKSNLGELFVPGREVVAYRDEDELVELASFYIEHDEERRLIATAGQRRTLAEHTYAHRMRELVEILARYVG